MLLAVVKYFLHPPVPETEGFHRWYTPVLVTLHVLLHCVSYWKRERRQRIVSVGKENLIKICRISLLNTVSAERSITSSNSKTSHEILLSVTLQ